DEVHLDAAGAGRAGGELRRDPGQQAGLPVHGQDRQGVVRDLPRQLARGLFQDHRAVEDAAGHLRQRQDGLRALRRLGQCVEPASEVAGPSGAASAGAGAWSKLSAVLWRRPWARATLLLTPPLAWFLLIYVAALVVLLITAFWEINPFTSNLEHVWNFGN